MRWRFSIIAYCACRARFSERRKIRRRLARHARLWCQPTPPPRLYADGCWRFRFEETAGLRQSWVIAARARDATRYKDRPNFKNIKMTFLRIYRADADD